MEAERVGGPGAVGVEGLRRRHQACRYGDPQLPITQKSLIPRYSSGEGCPSLCFWVLGAAGGFFCTWVRHCVHVSVGRGAPFSEMNPLFQSAYEGSQAVEGEVGEAAAWSPGAGGRELGAGPGGGSPWESARAVCVCSVQPLTVGGEKQVLVNPTTIPPTPREGRRSKGGGRGCSRHDPAPCGQRAGRLETV